MNRATLHLFVQHGHQPWSTEFGDSIGASCVLPAIVALGMLNPPPWSSPLGFGHKYILADSPHHQPRSPPQDKTSGSGSGSRDETFVVCFFSNLQSFSKLQSSEVVVEEQSGVSVYFVQRMHTTDPATCNKCISL